MIARSQAESLPRDELLARFVVFRGHVRADGTVKSDAFLPPSDLQLSVTRHRGLSEDQLWDRGQQVAKARAVERSASLIGRADLTAELTSIQGLRVDPAPLPDDLNHANIVGWPAEKPAQKNVAQRLAAGAKFVGWVGTTLTD